MITVGGTKVKEIYVGTSPVGKVYVGSEIVWQMGGSGDEINEFDGTISDIAGYLRYANLTFNTSSDNNNLIACCVVKPETTYKVQMLMDTRFRVFTYQSKPASGTVISGAVIDELDTNGANSIGEVREVSITSKAGHNMLYIGYWSSAGGMQSIEVRNSIRVTEVKQNE